MNHLYLSHRLRMTGTARRHLIDDDHLQDPVGSHQTGQLYSDLCLLYPLQLYQVQIIFNHENIERSLFFNDLDTDPNENSERFQIGLLINNACNNKFTELLSHIVINFAIFSIFKKII